MDRYPIETLPVSREAERPVYFVFDSDDGPAIESDYVDTVGVDDERRLIVCCGEYHGDKVGLKDRCFLTRGDAERHIEDSTAFTDAYGTTDLWPDDMPFRPASTCTPATTILPTSSVVHATLCTSPRTAKFSS